MINFIIIIIPLLKLLKQIFHSVFIIYIAVILPCCITELLFTLIEPLVGPSSIQFANGQDWEDRRKWLYDSFKGPHLESYVSHFVDGTKIFVATLCGIV